MINSFQLQIEFLKQIKNGLSPNASFADEIAEALNVSMDSAYRRIRGETALTIEEARVLSLRYNISVDQLIRQSANSITFNYTSINPDTFTFEQYYSNILNNIQQVDDGEKKEIVYVAKDMPVFNLFHFPELAAFKIFFWMKTVMSFPGMENKSFSPEVVDEKIIQLGKKILDIYIRIPTIEIWNEETIVGTLRQLEYSYESGLIKKKEDAALLFEKIEKLIAHIQKQAEHGIKFIYGKEPVYNEGNYKLFINETLLSDNTIFVKKDSAMSTYITHNAINYLMTANKNFCEETGRWLVNFQKKSCLISVVSEKERNKFFRSVFDKIQISKAKFL